MSETDEELAKHHDAKDVGLCAPVFDPVTDQKKARRDRDSHFWAMLAEGPECEGSCNNESEKKGCGQPVDDALRCIEIGCCGGRYWSEGNPVP